jgi:hypothetical protein
MAIITNEILNSNAIGNRELLLDVIYNVAPAETPVLTNAGQMTLNREVADWQGDTLRAAATNAQLEGDWAGAAGAFSFPSFVPTLRWRNQCQIMRELVVVSGSQDIVNKAGRGSELQYKVAQGAMALKRDVEFNFLANTIPVARAAATAPVAGGLPNWIKTNTDKGTGAAADPVHTTVSGITAPTTALVDGTTRVVNEASIRNALQKAFTSGGSPTTMMCPAVTKQSISQLGGVATKTFYQDAASPSVIISAADVYVSDYGKLAVIPNRFMRGSGTQNEIMFLDWDLLAVGFLREFEVLELAKNADAEQRMLLVEGTLIVKNEAGLAIARDFNN